MHNYIEYFKLPLWLIMSLMIIFGFMQGIGEFLEFKGKVVPEIMKIRKRIARKKREKEAIRKLPDFLDKQEVVFKLVNKSKHLIVKPERLYLSLIKSKALCNLKADFTSF